MSDLEYKTQNQEEEVQKSGFRSNIHTVM